jgi:hypothetical protein
MRPIFILPGISGEKKTSWGIIFKWVLNELYLLVWTKLKWPWI